MPTLDPTEGVTTPPTLSPDDPRHGTTNGYCNLRCRCERCREAWATYNRKIRERRKSRVANNQQIQHGTESTYTNHRCKCQPCKAAHAVAALARRRAKAGGA